MRLDIMSNHFLPPCFQPNFFKETKVCQPFGRTKISDALWTDQFKEFVEKEGKSEEIAYSFFDYYMVAYQGLNIKIVYEILQGKIRRSTWRAFVKRMEISL